MCTYKCGLFIDEECREKTFHALAEPINHAERRVIFIYAVVLTALRCTPINLRLWYFYFGMVYFQYNVVFR